MQQQWRIFRLQQRLRILGVAQHEHGVQLTGSGLVQPLRRGRYKLVQALGQFPLPVEVIPMAANHIARRFQAMGGQASLRLKDGQPLVTDNGQHILDVKGLSITDPLAFESQINQWPGVVTVGVFAHQKATVCLLGTAQGVKTLDYSR